MLYQSEYQNPSPFVDDFGLMMQANISSHYFGSTTNLTNLPNFQTCSFVHDQSFTPTNNSSSISNNSTSDEGDELLHDDSIIIDERKKRRMISNRESARRSRMRKQKHLDELWSQVVHLRTENFNLIDKLNHISNRHDKVVQENARLKEEASDLRRTLNDVQLATTFNSLEEIPCTTAHLRAESYSTQSLTNSTNLLQ